MNNFDLKKYLAENKLFEDSISRNLNERMVWKSSEFEEMYNNISDIINNLGYIKNPRRESIFKTLLELQEIIENEGLVDVNSLQQITNNNGK